jgi:cytochrome c-type biogenesis protein CcmH
MFVVRTPPFVIPEFRTAKYPQPGVVNAAPRSRRSAGRTGRTRGLLAAFCLFALLTPAHAVEPGEMLKDPALEARARAISQELRCVVCQNQSIDDSNAPLAHDLRVIVRERLSAGDSDQAVLNFVVARYGEFVLLRPRLEPQTLLLWLAPLLLAGAVVALLRYFRQRALSAGPDTVPLTPQEQKRLDEVLLGAGKDRS